MTDNNSRLTLRKVILFRSGSSATWYYLLPESARETTKSCPGDAEQTGFIRPHLYHITRLPVKKNRWTSGIQSAVISLQNSLIPLDFWQSARRQGFPSWYLTLILLHRSF